MTRCLRVASLAAASALVVTLSPAAASAAPCATRAEVREQIAELRSDMRDDVKSAQARSATAEAVREVIATFREAAEADTAEERENLGRQISAKLKEMRGTHNEVEKEALGLEIKALREDRERGPLNAEDRAGLKAAYAELRGTVLAKADNGVERRELASDFRKLREAITC
jgi:hypothetical protein